MFKNLFSWIRRPIKNRPYTRSPRTFRPSLEALENRVVPTTVVDFEPNDSFDAPQVIMEPAIDNLYVITGSLADVIGHPNQDFVDYYQLALSPTHNYTFSIRRTDVDPTGNMGPLLALVRPVGGFQNFDTGSDTMGEGSGQVALTGSNLPVAGDYRLVVFAQQSETFGTYQLDIGIDGAQPAAPFQRVNDRTIAFKDVDGEWAVIASDKNVFAGDDAKLNSIVRFRAQGSGQQLERIDLTNIAAAKGAQLSIFAATDQLIRNEWTGGQADVKQPLLLFFTEYGKRIESAQQVQNLRGANPVVGNGNVHVGAIISNNYLKSVVVRGDVGRVVVGDNKMLAKQPVVEKLIVNNLGDTTLEGPNSSTQSVIRGHLRNLEINGSMFATGFLQVQLDLTKGVVTNAISGILTVRNIIDLTVKSVEGLDSDNSGRITCTANLTRLTITDGLTGGQGNFSGLVYVQGNINKGGAVKIGFIEGGNGIESGRLLVGNFVKGKYVGGAVQSPIHVVGGLKGGAGNISGSISIGSSSAGIRVGFIEGGGGAFSGRVLVQADLNGITVEGRLLGGTGPDSGTVRILGNLKGASFFGYIQGGNGPRSGTLYVEKSVRQAININGSLEGGVGPSSGRIDLLGSATDIILGDQIKGGDGTTSGNIFVQGNLNLVKAPRIAGGVGEYSGVVQVKATPVKGKLVGGNLNSAIIKGDIEGGVGPGSGRIEAPNGKIGSLLVEGSLRGGMGAYSGNVYAKSIGSLDKKGNPIGYLIIYGSIFGGSSEGAGRVHVEGFVSSIRVDHDVVGGSGLHSGIIWSGKYVNGGAIGFTVNTLFIGGAVIGGTGVGSGRLEAGDITNLQIVNGFLHVQGEGSNACTLVLTKSPKQIQVFNLFGYQPTDASGNPIPIVATGGGEVISRGGGAAISRGGGSAIGNSSGNFRLVSMLELFVRS